MLRNKSIGAGLLLCVFYILLVPAVWAQAERFDGRPAFKEGSDMGYFVWREGDTWKVRWTTTGAMRHFTGHVSAEGGELKSLKRIDVESERKIIRPGHAPRVVVGRRGRVYRRGGTPAVVATREQDHIEKDGDRRINFDAKTDDDIDGFDFKVDERVTALRFNLAINGKTMPSKIETGRDNQHPPTAPFEVKLH